jgi:hypothetical protein
LPAFAEESGMFKNSWVPLHPGRDGTHCALTAVR